MGALGRHIMKAWRDYGRGSSLESDICCYRTGHPFSEDATSHSYRIDDVWTRVRKRPKGK